MLLLTISFIGGVLTILAPCILPLLPVIIGGSIADGRVDRRKTYTIILSLGVSVLIFTLLLKASTIFIDIPPNVWSLISGGVIILLGTTFLFPQIMDMGFIARLNRSSNIALGAGLQKKSFWGDVITGAALGPVFSTCSPTYFIVIATVLPASPLLGLLYLLAYTLGLCLALFAVSLVGQRIMSTLGIAADPRGWFKRILGLIFLIVGIAIIFGFDKKSQIFLLDRGFFDVTKIEQKLLEIDTPNKIKAPQSTEDKNSRYKLAPELSSIDGYVNTDGVPITLEELRNKKVVLLDIWTYSCINCQRTIPYLNEWYEKYKDQGLEIVGLHTPEFAFEKVLKNVEGAVKDFDIKYPVALDNDYSTWNALGNRYWPRKYLIDIDGYIIYDHAGEGAYEETEREIQKALLERNQRLGEGMDLSSEVSVVDAVSPNRLELGSPEIYFGSLRNDRLANGEPGISKIQNLVVPETKTLNNLYLGGSWSIGPEFSENLSSGQIVFKYKARDVYFVASSDTPHEAEIYQDGLLIKTITIQADKLYHLIEGADYKEHLLEIRIQKPGVRAYTFTFG